MYQSVVKAADYITPVRAFSNGDMGLKRIPKS